MTLVKPSREGSAAAVPGTGDVYCVTSRSLLLFELGLISINAAAFRCANRNVDCSPYNRKTIFHLEVFHETFP
jgi:hypothetical protein